MDSTADRDEIDETRAILETPGAMDEIRQSLCEFDEGKVEDWEQVKAEFSPGSQRA